MQTWIRKTGDCTMLNILILMEIVLLLFWNNRLSYFNIQNFDNLNNNDILSYSDLLSGFIPSSYIYSIKNSQKEYLTLYTSNI